MASSTRNYFAVRIHQSEVDIDKDVGVFHEVEDVYRPKPEPRGPRTQANPDSLGHPGALSRVDSSVALSSLGFDKAPRILGESPRA